MVDGQPAVNSETIKKSAEGVTSIRVPYTSGFHDITIIGTQVVPEFPFSFVAIVIASTIGGIVAISRMKGGGASILGADP
jgi:hypothetical protein